MSETTLILVRTATGLSLADTEDTDWCSACEEVTVWQGEHCTRCARQWGTEPVKGLQDNGLVLRLKEQQGAAQ